MSGHYVIVVDRHARRLRLDAPGLTEACAERGLSLAFEQAGAIVFASATPSVLKATNGRWLAIGQVFARRDVLSSQDIHDLDDLDDVLRNAWGGYVGLQANPEGTVRVLRDPSGALPCWMVSGSEVTVFTDDAELGLAIADLGRPSIDRGRLAQLLLFSDLRDPETPIAGVAEVQPGTARTKSATGSRWLIEVPWSPWQFARVNDRIDDPNKAIDLLRQWVDTVVAAWAGTLERPLVELSGGLDSSIVAASLVASGASLDAVTMVTPGPDGDERRYAAAVTDCFGGTLREVAAVPEMIDLRRSASSHLPRPESRAFAQAGDRLNLETACLLTADGFLSGGGGDNVFGFYNSALPAADRLRVAGIGAPALATIGDAALLTRRTFWRTGRRAMVRAWFDRRLPKWPSDPSLLAADVTSCPMPAHPWLEPPDDVLPGKHWHVRLLIAIQNHVGGFARGGLPMIFPLLSQPLVETALRIPSWLWIDGGRDRAMVRRAFADRLPTTIVERRTKGGLDSLADAVFSQHHRTLAGMLLDGWLAGAGIIDRNAVEEALRKRLPAARLRLLALADVEAWAGSWR